MGLFLLSRKNTQLDPYDSVFCALHIFTLYRQINGTIHHSMYYFKKNPITTLLIVCLLSCVITLGNINIVLVSICENLYYVFELQMLYIWDV